MSIIEENMSLHLDDAIWPGHHLPSWRKKCYGVNLVKLIILGNFSQTDLTATNLIIGEVAFNYSRADWPVLPYFSFPFGGVFVVLLG